MRGRQSTSIQRRGAPPEAPRIATPQTCPPTTTRSPATSPGRASVSTAVTSNSTNARNEGGAKGWYIHCSAFRALQRAESKRPDPNQTAATFSHNQFKIAAAPRAKFNSRDRGNCPSQRTEAGKRYSLQVGGNDRQGPVAAAHKQPRRLVGALARRSKAPNLLHCR